VITEDRWSGTSEITLTNTGKESIYYEFEPGELSDNARLSFSLELQGKVNKGVPTNIQCKIRVHCTTNLYQLGKLHFFKTKPPNNGILRRRSVAQRDFANNPNICYVLFIVESENSSVIDYNELRVAELISKGEYGSTYKATWRQTPVVVKQLDAMLFTQDELEDISKTVAKLRYVEGVM
jgi:hypothetical protein